MPTIDLKQAKMKQFYQNIDDEIERQYELDLVCPLCYSEMKVELVKKGVEFKRIVERVVCSCGYHTIRRSRKEILRDLGEID